MHSETILQQTTPLKLFYASTRTYDQCSGLYDSKRLRGIPESSTYM